MTDTPDTDNLARGNHVVPTEFAQDLERQRNNFQDQRDFAMSEAERLEQERDQWRDGGLRQHNLLSASAAREDRLRERCRQLVQHAKDLEARAKDDLKESNARLEDALEYMKERNAARKLAESAMLEADRLRGQLWKARDRAWKLARERNHWKSESLEQAKLLAMSADREEKLRTDLLLARRLAESAMLEADRYRVALKNIAALDTSQDASPQQCGAVLLAMNALDK